MARRTYHPVLAERIGQRIRDRRTELGLKRAEVCQLTLLTGPTIWRYENGENAPSAESLCLLGHSLRCDPGLLLPTLNETIEILRLARR